MAAQPIESLSAMEVHHLSNMEMAHKRALVLRTSGTTDGEAADFESVSESTMKNRIATASSQVALGLAEGRRLTAELRGYWVAAHRSCCLAEAISALGGAAA
ncbi:MAG: hypothetical protein WBO97_10390 [Tepidiformaceae bacterium]